MRHCTLAAGFVLAIAVAAQAQAAGSTPSQPMSRSSEACDSARLAAWFDRQRQLTDGDVDPQKAVPAPRECGAMQVGSARDDARDHEANAEASQGAALIGS